MIGVEKSLACGVSNTIAIFLGVVTGVGGGLMRDVLSGEIPLVFRKGIYLYATAAFCGAGLFVLLGRLLPGYAANRLIAAAAILLLRLAAIRWKLSLPMFKLRSAETAGPARTETKLPPGRLIHPTCDAGTASSDLRARGWSGGGGAGAPTAGGRRVLCISISRASLVRNRHESPLRPAPGQSSRHGAAGFAGEPS